jgi:hypothetical protein
MATTKFPNTVQFESKERKGNKVVAMSGQRTRNMDWFSGKYFRFIPDGVRLNDYRANNILAWRHNTADPEDILGTSSVELEGGRLMTDPNINAPHDKARLVKKMWDMGILNAISVRLGLSKADIENVIETEEEIVFPSSELQEVSIVPIPADPGAVRQVAFSLGLNPERAEQLLLLEVNMDNETLEAIEEQEGEEGGAVVLELTAEDYVAFAQELVANEQAAHILRDALVASLIDEVGVLRNEVARLAGEPVRRQPVPSSLKLSFGNRQQDAEPPAHIRGPKSPSAGRTPKAMAASFQLRRNR